MARASDLGGGDLLKVDAGGRPLLLARVEDSYFALDDTCTHEEASLSEGFIEGRTVECPLHGATFSLSEGTALSLPATTDIRTYPVLVEAGDVLVELEPTNGGN